LLPATDTAFKILVKIITEMASLTTHNGTVGYFEKAGIEAQPFRILSGLNVHIG